jgi:ABC-type transporter Mla subunit MlaD
MNTTYRSFIVGTFVLAGLVLLGLMIYWFGQVAFYFRGGYIVHGHLPSAVGVREGKRVHMDGIDIGDVRDVHTSQPERPGVWVDMHINPGFLIPTYAEFVAQQSTIGDLYLDFQTSAKKPPAVTLYLKPKARVDGRVVAPTLLPEELVADVRKGLSTLKALEPVAANIQKLTEPPPLKPGEETYQRNLWSALNEFQEASAELRNQLHENDSNFNKLLRNANSSAQDLSETLRKAQETLAEATTTFKELRGRADLLADKLTDDADKVAETLAKLDKAVDQATETMTSINRTFDDINRGQGTLGKLATDDELYRALTTLMENLNVVADNANRLLTLWRQKGILANPKEGK